MNYNFKIPNSQMAKYNRNVNTKFRGADYYGKTIIFPTEEGCEAEIHLKLGTPYK